MSKLNFLKTGLYLGFSPIVALSFLLFIFWVGRTWFAVEISVMGIGFLVILVSIPLIFISFILIFISFFKQKERNIFLSAIALFSLLLNAPLALWIVKAHGDISSRAYLKIFNKSNYDIANLKVVEPDKELLFGSLRKKVAR